MPTPVAKGIIITVSALVAAGIAVYESPQFRQWVDNSRRKLAMALHHLGDEIQPRDAASPLQHDISMMEDMSPAAEERRQAAREELQRRRSVLEERQKRRSEFGLGSFDALVDESGRLLDNTEEPTHALASSTAVDLGASNAIQRGKSSSAVAPGSTLLPEAESASEKSGLHLSIPSPETRASSVAPAEFTPVSEASDSLSEALYASPPTAGHRPRSFSQSSHTEGGDSEVIYAHPGLAANETGQDIRSPFSDLSGLHFDQEHPSAPGTPSTAGSYSHIGVDGSSDGTLSEIGRSIGAMTPASWSEVGSEVSNDDYQHHGL